MTASSSQPLSLDTSSVKLEATPTKTPTKSPVKDESSEKGVNVSLKTKPSSKVDPVASLHAALGLTNSATATNKANKREAFSANASDDKQRKTEKEPSLYDSLLKAESNETEQKLDEVVETSGFNKSIEDELEETTKQPLSIEEPKETTVDGSFNESTDFDENLAESLVAGLQEPAVQDNAEKNEHAFSKNAFDIENTEDEWAQIVVKLDLVGTLEQIAYSSQFDWLSEKKVGLKVNPNLDLICSDSAKAGVEAAVIDYFGKTLSFEWSFGEPDKETPAMIFERLTKEKRRKACETLISHPFSQQLKNEFNAELQQQSVTFID